MLTTEAARGAAADERHAGLNDAQKSAVLAGDGPLLVIAGAGTGKTQTLAHRVAELVLRGGDPRRILLLTFTRRAAAEMARRAARVVARETGRRIELPWAGTFHAVGARVLRPIARAAGLDPQFTVLDREDAADFVDRIRHDLGLSRTDRRFPRKGTCLAIYSRVVNTGGTLDGTLEEAFPWCLEWRDELKRLFRAYVDGKLARHLLDYDDLLLYWAHVMGDARLGREVGRAFDHVLVDEYQDTNKLQADIVRGLSPSGRGVTVVGDDAQAIYGFRAANVRNILDFPSSYDPPATIVRLEQSYRSTVPILSAANAVIAQSPAAFRKTLWSERRSSERPRLVTVADESAQVEYVVSRILERRESGVPLRQQAVLVRAAHHTAELEVELGRRNIPFVKYGGLRFLEASHVKDVVSCLRWAENPRDAIAAFRVVQLLPGFGPGFADRVVRAVEQGGYALASALAGFVPPAASAEAWAPFVALYARLCDAAAPWGGQLGQVRRWYEPHLERLYDDARIRLGDLEQLEQIAATSPSRVDFLSDLTLDPPDASSAEAVAPHLDEDHLVLSTVHSAKGQEWDTVFVLNLADGCFPSDLATTSAEQIDEERRLLYVAMTRAKNSLTLVHPLRFFIRQQSRYGDRHVLTPRSRFITDEMLDLFERGSYAPVATAANDARPTGAPPFVDVATRLRERWM